MEDEKRKKKNKKKKNKQHKASEDPAVGVEETIGALDENHLSAQTHPDQNSIADVQNGDVQKENVDLNGHCANGTDSSILAEAEKQKWLQREVSLQERIKQLENEKDLHTQKESILVEAEKQKWLQREVSLQERIKQFEKEKELHTQKEATLEERIKQLQNENDSHLQMEADMDTKILLLQTEKHSWIKKEAILEGKIKQLLDENSTLSQKWAILEEKVELQEREKNSWILKENSSREIISSLNDDNRKLQAQVLELEEFRNNILPENQLLKENITSLDLRIKELQSVASARTSAEITKHASEHVDLNPQTDATTALVEKLTSENADLVEKVNGLCIELDRLRVAAGISSAIVLDKKIGTWQSSSVAADHMPEPIDDGSALGENIEFIEAVPIHDQISIGDVPVNAERISADSEDTEQTAVIPNSSETDDSGEIVQISLDENEARELELHAAENDRKITVPITDAPLIGAPFRFISFVAKYVSGADLVRKSSSN